jgi:hypothetical protein
MVLVGLAGGSVEAAGRRVALVVGNSNYENVAPLTNPANDATAIAGALKAAGFDDVKLIGNLGQSQLLRALRDFTGTATGAETAVVYFAGHGVEVDGRNYLVPTDATLAKATDVDFEAVSLDAVRTAVSGASKLRLVILDACRNNPFKLASSDGKRSVNRGLARIEPGANELIAYAAREGTVASDGDGGNSVNSPYAASLVKYLAEPGLEVRLLFGRVRDDVKAATGNTQEPFIYGTLGGDALFLKDPVVANAAPDVPAKTASPPPAPSGISGEAAQLWPLVEKTTSCGVLQSFIDRVSKQQDNPFIGFALARKKELNCDAAAAPTAVPAAPKPPPAVQQQATAEPGDVDKVRPPTVITRTLTPSIVQVGKWAEGVAFDGKVLWVAESGQRSIVAIAKDGSIIRRASVGRLPVGMASLPDGRVYALVQTDKIVWQETPGSSQGKRLTSLKECPQALAAGPKALWVLTLPDCSSEQSRAVKIDPASGRQAPTAELGEWGQAITIGHGKVWVAHARGPALSIIDPQSLAVEPGNLDRASLWAITANRTAVFAGGRIDEDNGQGLLVSIDPASHAERNRLLVNERVAAVAADDQSVAAIGENGTIWVAAAADLKLQRVDTLSIGAYHPSSAIIVGNQLVVVAQQYSGENGAVFVVNDWR